MTFHPDHYTDLAIRTVDSEVAHPGGTNFFMGIEDTEAFRVALNAERRKRGLPEKDYSLPEYAWTPPSSPS